MTIFSSQVGNDTRNSCLKGGGVPDLLNTATFYQDDHHGNAHFSETTGQIFSIQSSVYMESSRPVVVQCHGHLPIYLLWACPWDKYMSQMMGTHISGSTSPVSSKLHELVYRQISDIEGTLVGNKIVDHLDIVGAASVSTAPTTSSCFTWHLASIDCTKTTIRQDKKHFSFGIWCGLY